MCTIPSIKLIMSIFQYVKAFCAFLIFVSGAGICSNAQYQQAYGFVFVSYGVGGVMLGMMSGVNVPVMVWAISKHNRFVIMCSFIVDFICMVSLIALGNNISSHTIPEFSKELQMDCLLKTPQIFSVDDCLPFFNADRTAGFRVLWESFYADKENVNSFQSLTQLEGDLCCGFYAPMGCITNNASFPEEFRLDELTPEFLTRRVTCGSMPGYYPSTDICLDYFDASTIPPIIGGCKWDLAVGYCADNTLKASTRGCASKVEDFLASEALPLASFFTGLSFINLMAILISCCMFWKRRESDVFPLWRVSEGKINYHNVKMQYEIKPVKDLLKKKGFVSKSEEDVALEARIAAASVQNATTLAT